MADRPNSRKDVPPVANGGKGGQTTQAAPPRHPPAPTFEGYEILHELPRGGQALVYKAIHKATKSKVALKVLPPGQLASAKARHLFEREVDLISSLEHPYIVHIRDSGIAEGQYYFAMEYIHGRPLDEHITDRNASLRPTMELFFKVCEAVSYAHRRGVIHRDLKPTNILVDDRGDPHVLDFGLAKSAGRPGDGPSMVSVTGEIKGTLAYMSPEQASGQSYMVDTRSDVYSLGVMFYHVLTHEFPYDVSGSTAQTLHNIETADPVRPRRILHRFDSDVGAILLKALAKAPSDRYHSVAELGEDIRRWLQYLPINARLSTFYMLRKLVRRHALSSTILGLLLVILVGFSCTYYYLYGQLRIKNRQLERAMAEIYTERESSKHLEDQLAFVHALNLWQERQNANAESAGRLFAEGTRERQAVQFLLDGRPLSEKSAEFRERLGLPESFFAAFVVAEHHLRDGDRQQALSLFRQALQQARSEDEVILSYRVRERIAQITRKVSADQPQERADRE